MTRLSQIALLAAAALSSAPGARAMLSSRAYQGTDFDVSAGPEEAQRRIDLAEQKRERKRMRMQHQAQAQQRSRYSRS